MFYIYFILCFSYSYILFVLICFYLYIMFLYFNYMFLFYFRKLKQKENKRTKARKENKRKEGKQKTRKTKNRAKSIYLFHTFIYYKYIFVLPCVSFSRFRLGVGAGRNKPQNCRVQTPLLFFEKKFWESPVEVWRFPKKSLLLHLTLKISYFIRFWILGMRCRCETVAYFCILRFILRF